MVGNVGKIVFESRGWHGKLNGVLRWFMMALLVTFAIAALASESREIVEP